VIAKKRNKLFIALLFLADCERGVKVKSNFWAIKKPATKLFLTAETLGGFDF
jgi:hypothetical protein